MVCNSNLGIDVNCDGTKKINTPKSNGVNRNIRRKLQRLKNDKQHKKYHYFELIDFKDLPFNVRTYLIAVKENGFNREEYEKIIKKYPTYFDYGTKKYFEYLEELRK